MRVVWMRGLSLLGCLLMLAACGKDKPKPSSPACEPGALDCTCDADGACGEGLVCDRGYCVEGEPGECVAGTTGCPCDGGQCEEGARCNEAEVCEPADCDAGTEGCGCVGPDDTCEEGLACVGGLCRPTVGLGLRVGEEVRACDLLMDTSARSIVSVSFGDEVEGRSRHEGELLAISFAAKSDAPIDGAVLTFNLAGEGDFEPTQLVFELQSCSGPTGEKITDPTLEVGP